MGIFHWSINLLLTGPLFLLQSSGAAGINPTGHWIRGRDHFIHMATHCLGFCYFILQQKLSHFSFFEIVTVSITLSSLLCRWVTSREVEFIKTPQHSIHHLYHPRTALRCPLTRIKLWVDLSNDILQIISQQYVQLSFWGKRKRKNDKAWRHGCWCKNVALITYFHMFFEGCVTARWSQKVKLVKTKCLASLRGWQRNYGGTKCYYFLSFTKCHWNVEPWLSFLSVVRIQEDYTDIFFSICRVRIYTYMNSEYRWTSCQNIYLAVLLHDFVLWECR